MAYYTVVLARGMHAKEAAYEDSHHFVVAPVSVFIIHNIPTRVCLLLSVSTLCLNALSAAGNKCGGGGDYVFIRFLCCCTGPLSFYSILKFCFPVLHGAIYSLECVLKFWIEAYPLLVVGGYESF